MEEEKMKFERVCPAALGRERNRMPRKARVSGQMKALTAARRTLHGIKFEPGQKYFLNEQFFATTEDMTDYNVVHHKAEEARVAIRNIRRHAKDALEKLRKDGQVGEDDERRAEKELETLTHTYVAHVDEALKHKEAELLEV